MEKDPTQTSSILELDLSTDEWTQRLTEAPVYAKKSLVQIRKASPGEVVTTTLADGTVETSNTAGENDVVITNPGGEQYIIDADKAEKRYEPTTEDGVYRAKGMARALTNPTGAPIEITAPWGEKQFGDADCLIATVFDPAQPDVVSSDRYIIGANEFQDTYGPADEVLDAPE